jgi:hypothetical protein
MPDRFAAWKASAQIFLLSRLLILCVTCTCILVLPGLIPGYLTFVGTDSSTYQMLPSQPLNVLLFSWLHWDAKAYLNISYLGYHYLSDTGFFPLWPLVQHMGGILLGGSFPVSYYLAGLLLANLFFYFDLVMLYHLIAKEYGTVIARRVLFYFSFSPCALFFFAGYSESLFVLLTLGMFLCLQRGRSQDWWLAGLCGLLATLTRSAGLILALPFLAVSLQRFWWVSRTGQCNWPQTVRASMPVVLIPAGLVIYMIYLYVVAHDTLLFFHEENTVWHRSPTFPLLTIWLALQSFPRETLFVLQVENFLNLTASLFPFALLLRGWRSLPLHYILFATGIALFALSFPTIIAQNEPLLSLPRYMMILFPITLLLARWGKNPRFDAIYRFLTLLAFVCGVALFVSNVWVA